MTIDIDAPIRPSGQRSRRTIESTAVDAALARGETIVLWDDERAWLGYAADTATTAQTAFVIRHTSGFLQIALPSPACDRLLIPLTPALPSRPSAQGYQQCIGVDAAQGVTTGISAADRARTAGVLADSRTDPGDLVRPGHLVVVAVDPDYSGKRAVPRLALRLDASGHGGLVFAELVSSRRPHTMADEHDAVSFALAHQLRMCAGVTTPGASLDALYRTYPPAVH
ncbi:3,4-dihydroxy-2-butanone-4-phosphate synthase [Rhodococcus opacus]|jgi:3,4-dihydroxy-2-butanone 4-phosphate synthase|uniref:3,4-dihydroxy-2-butanone-4-phosphate synthase n=1 Tax=Rhodococcus opacus TaxID=37919 RepID=UPI00247685D1|nr:3,4-dihydroxy-2-butanone-4-phosphate synthase [Rhodococcus opacus]MDH6287759.1 3,4-dihydroxy 2-butanone 4-phosphate synthase [Rhodococcus opacus]